MTTSPKDLETLLDNYAKGALHQIAAHNNISTSDGSGKNLLKAGLVSKMATALFTKAQVEKSFASLNDTERQVLITLQRAPNNSLMVPTLKTTLLNGGYIDPTPETKSSNWRWQAGRDYVGQPERKESKVLEDVLARLTEKGLVFSEEPVDNTQQKMRFDPGERAFIPEAVNRYLPPPPSIDELLEAVSPGYTQRGEPEAFVRNLYLYWDYVRQNGLALLKSGLVGKRGMKALNEELLTPLENMKAIRDETDALNLYQYRILLTHLNLVTTQSQTLISTIPADTIPDFWAQPVTKQLRQCFKIWLQDANQPGMSDDFYGDAPTVNKAKKSLFAALKQFSAENWISFHALLEQLQFRDMNFLYPDHSAIASKRREFIYHRAGNRYFSGYKNRILKEMQKNEVQFIRQCVVQLLYPLGLVNLGWEDEKPTETPKSETFWAVALTPLGKAVLNDEDPPNDTDAGHQGSIIIQPDFQIMAMGPVSTHILAELDMLAEREKVDANAFTYRLTRESVYAAQQQGWTADAVAEKLDSLSEVPLAKNIKRSLAEWGAQHQRIRFQHGVTLVEGGHQSLMSQVEQALSHLNPQELSSTILKLESVASSEVIEALLAVNLPARSSQITRESLEGSIKLSAEGRIETISTLPNLKLKQLLDSFAEPLDDNHWQLTPDSVQAHISQRSELQAWLDTLQTLTGADLPAGLVAQLKKWSGYYGQATLKTLTVLTLETPAVLQELRQHPELGDRLKQLPGQSKSAESALAVVPKGEVAQVKAILAELGLTLAMDED